MAFIGSKKAAFERFYQEHIDKVYRYVFFHCNANRAVAEDLVSDIFLKALNNFDTYDETKSRSAWIITIARNTVYNYWRDHKKEAPLPEDEADSEASTDADHFWLTSARQVFAKEASRREVYELLATLSVEERDLVTMHYLVGYSYAEIAADLGSTEGAVKVAVHRAMKKLQAVL